jgi:CxxC motif-containing protein (DUF1111 family)
MAASPSRPPSHKAQMAERRWNRARQTSERSCTDAALRGGRPRSGGTPPSTEQAATSRWLSRRWLGRAAGALAVGVLGYAALGGMSGPSEADLHAGQELFTHKWSPHDSLSGQGDGLGPVFNAHSCVECHFQGGIGGGGGLKQNVAAFEVLPTLNQPDPTGGVIHAFATEPTWQESSKTVRSLFPIVPKGVTITAVCQQPLQKDYDPVVPHSINTPTLFGAGAIDRITDVALRTQLAQRRLAGMGKELQLDFAAPSVGRLRVLPDGRIGKFGWKAQFATLDEFVANACAVELGLSTPTRKQHLPQKHREDTEAQPDLTSRQFTQLVAYVAHLPVPKGSLPTDASQQTAVRRGRELFGEIGCAECHTPDLGGATGVYSDFCLHDITTDESDGYTETPDIPIPEDYPKGGEWKTPPLWGAAQTAPYLHDGSAPTLLAAIEAHGRQARTVREKFRQLAKVDQQALLRFLGSLTVE